MALQPFDYASMAADTARMDAYVHALEQTVRPGDTVLDLGCGTGVMAIIAAKLGAQRVYALDCNPCAELVPRMALDNGCSEQVRAICAEAQKVELEERVDLIVFDLRGVLPFYGRSVEVLIDARDRLLKPSGRLVPLQDRLHVALASTPDIYAKLLRPWGERDYGVRWESLTEIFSSNWGSRRIRANSIVSQPQLWTELDYRTVTSPDASGVVECVVERTSEVHGFFVWFDSELAPGIKLSGGPDSKLEVYGSAFFPWPKPLKLNEGDAVQISLSARSVGPDYVWSWQTSAGSIQYNQSSLSATIWSLAQLKKRAAGYAPQLSNSGAVDLHILQMMKAGSPLGEIAKSVFAHFPKQFKTEAQALGHVGKLSSIYST